MIKLNDVSKSYVSKSKQRVDALKDVNFELPNKGMVFILGKSGSGKSTLLNLLGGLDAPTKGEIVVDGVSMKDFAPKDYDGYRNGYVGFIFQEYNLLDDFNVKDNIAIALQLSEENGIDEKVKCALQQVELNDDYLLRRVGEMSGGEKQRIAIARCIVKDSKMVLADEPTGNLDSVTGESIWNILKKLSQSKLVVVVSHDRESAEKYGDRIIEIADGRVTADSGATVEKGNETKTDEKSVENTSTKNAKKRLPLRVCLQMGLNNLAQRKVKTVSVILLAILTILTLLITETFIAFSPAKSVAKFVNRYDVPYFTLQQYKKGDDSESRYNHILRDDTLAYVEKNSDYIIDGIVENKQQILDFGFSFIGDALELTSESFYATSRAIRYSLDNYFEENYFIDEEGDPVNVNLSTPLEWLIGRRVYFSRLTDSEDNLPILAGIIDSDAIDEIARDYIPFQFVREDYECKSNYFSSISVNNSTSNAVLRLGEGAYPDRFEIKDEISSRGLDRCLLTAEGIVPDDEIDQITLNDDEVVLTFELYEQLIDADYKWTYVDPSTFEILDAANLPIDFDKKLELKFCNSVSGDVIADLGEVKLAGIVFQTFRTTYERNSNLEMCLSEQNCEKLQDLLDTTKTMLIKSDSVKNLNNFLTVLDNKYDTYSVNAGKITRSDGSGDGDVVGFVYSIEGTVKYVMFIIIAICAIMVVVLVLLVINLISFSITNRKKEIGILSALGTSNRDIIKIFIFETLVIAVISFVVTLILSFATTVTFNILATRDYDEFISLFRVDALTIAVLSVSSFGLLLLAAWIPTRKIAKLKPIDAIRNV